MQSVNYFQFLSVLRSTERMDDKTYVHSLGRLSTKMKYSIEENLQLMSVGHIWQRNKEDKSCKGSVEQRGVWMFCGSVSVFGGHIEVVEVDIPHSLMHFTSQSLHWWGLRSHFSVQFMFDEVIDFLLPLPWMFLSISLLSVRPVQLRCHYFLTWRHQHLATATCLLAIPRPLCISHVVTISENHKPFYLSTNGQWLINYPDEGTTLNIPLKENVKCSFQICWKRNAIHH